MENTNSKIKKIIRHKYFPRVIILILIIIGWAVYEYAAYYDTYSDDSYVYAYVVNITSLVSGPIIKIYIKDNQYVKAGQKLLEIDPRPFEYALEKAKAKLKAAKINYQEQVNLINSAKDNLAQSQENLRLSQDHLKRFKKVEQAGGLAFIKLIDLESTIRNQEAQVATATQQVLIAKQNLNDAAINAAKAQLKQAQYNLNHTTIYAPADGYISNFQLRKGQYIKADKPYFALVESDNWWIITRYRETVLRKIKIGNKVKIRIDMYPNKIFHGYVESIAWGINREQSSSDAAPSTLAYLEATEDWIRIAQRFPVRIRITDLSKQYPLRVGASARTTVYEK